MQYSLTTGIISSFIVIWLSFTPAISFYFTQQLKKNYFSKNAKPLPLLKNLQKEQKNLFS